MNKFLLDAIRANQIYGSSLSEFLPDDTTEAPKDEMGNTEPGDTRMTPEAVEENDTETLLGLQRRLNPSARLSARVSLGRRIKTMCYEYKELTIEELESLDEDEVVSPNWATKQ